LANQAYHGTSRKSAQRFAATVGRSKRSRSVLI
jgi:hypothetical protein